MVSIIRCILTLMGKSPEDPREDENHQSDVVVKEKYQLKRPSLYKVLIHNDDYTTMDFVVLVLKKYFGKSQEEATLIMLNIHEKGLSIGGVYTYEVAETKCQKITLFAKQKGHPLKCTIEKN